MAGELYQLVKVNLDKEKKNLKQDLLSNDKDYPETVSSEFGNENAASGNINASEDHSDQNPLENTFHYNSKTPIADLPLSYVNNENIEAKSQMEEVIKQVKDTNVFSISNSDEDNQDMYSNFSNSNEGNVESGRS